METTETCRLGVLERRHRRLAQFGRARARPVRFVITGGTAGILQLALLAAFTDAEWSASVANVVAFALAAQVNFALSVVFTWRDRRHGASDTLARRWLAFHGSIIGTFALNQLVFLAARAALPTLLASALGIVCAALLNYLVFDRIVFRSRGGA